MQVLARKREKTNPRFGRYTDLVSLGFTEGKLVKVDERGWRCTVKDEDEWGFWVVLWHLEGGG